MTAEEQVALYLKQGWCPVKWSHHPKVIKDILRAIRLVPGMKECFANCQRFVTDVDLHGFDLNVEYREGYVVSILPIEHAWLTVNGEVVDLTLAPDRPREYLDSYAVPVDEIRRNMLEQKAYCPVRPQELMKLSPFYESFLQLAKLNGMHP